MIFMYAQNIIKRNIKKQIRADSKYKQLPYLTNPIEFNSIATVNSKYTQLSSFPNKNILKVEYKMPVKLYLNNTLIDMTGSIAETPTPFILLYKNCRNRVELGETREVIKFLLNNKFLISIINEVIAKTKKLFKNEKLILDIIHDPEIKNSDVIALIIETKSDVKKVHNILNEFNDW